MEWNWCWNNGNDVSPFLLSESSGDSEEAKSVIYQHQYDYYGRADNEIVMHEYEETSFRFDDENDDGDDDDAQSCSYDHSSYINTSYGNNGHHGQSQSLVYDDDDDDDSDVDDGEDDDENKNWGESKMMDQSKQEKISRKFRVESLDQREVDKRFWETCLAT